METIMLGHLWFLLCRPNGITTMIQGRNNHEDSVNSFVKSMQSPCLPGHPGPATNIWVEREIFYFLISIIKVLFI